jgi:hypothetical protein
LEDDRLIDGERLRHSRLRVVADVREAGPAGSYERDGRTDGQGLVVLMACVASREPACAEKAKRQCYRAEGAFPQLSA